MTREGLKQLLDVCFTAKRVIETQPELPKGMKPRQIHVLETVYEIRQRQGICRVSDVSSYLDITMPSVTKLIQGLEGLGMLEKQADEEDRRVALLCLTERGEECVKRYVFDFHRDWVEAMQDVTEEQVQNAVVVMENLRASMPGRKEGKERYGTSKR